MFNKKNKAVAELRDMLPVYVAVTAAVVCFSAVYGIFAGLLPAVKMIAGVLVGTAVSVLNLLGIGYTARLAVRQRAQKRAAFIGSAGYGIRYVSVAVIFAALLMFRAVNLLTMFAPMFVPKIYYTFIYTYKMRKNAEKHNVTEA